jgi:hypothetical protein
MNPDITTGLAAVLGSLAGAVGSTLGTWLNQRNQNRRDLLTKKIIHREALYSEFIRESEQLLADALENSTVDLKTLLPVYSLASRIRLSSPPEIMDAAENVIQRIVKIYGEPSPTPQQIQARALRGENPLRDFSEICRVELESMLSQA